MEEWIGLFDPLCIAVYLKLPFETLKPFDSEDTFLLNKKLTYDKIEIGSICPLIFHIVDAEKGKHEIVKIRLELKD